MKRSLILVLFILFSVFIVSASGFDDEGNPNDPAINERANACYEGGEWENKCETELQWVAGWYLIRLNSGLFAPEDIPAWLSWILPPVAEDEAVVVGSNHCYPFSGKFLIWTGGYGMKSNVTLYTDSACTNDSGISYFMVIVVAVGDTPVAQVFCDTINQNAISFALIPALNGQFYSCT